MTTKRVVYHIIKVSILFVIVALLIGAVEDAKRASYKAGFQAGQQTANTEFYI